LSEEAPLLKEVEVPLGVLLVPVLVGVVAVDAVVVVEGTGLVRTVWEALVVDEVADEASEVPETVIDELTTPPMEKVAEVA